VSSPSLQPFTVFGFATTHDALSAESALIDAQVPVRVIPVPKALGSLCGLALRVPQAVEVRACDVLIASAIVATGQASVRDR